MKGNDVKSVNTNHSISFKLNSSFDEGINIAQKRTASDDHGYAGNITQTEDSMKKKNLNTTIFHL